MSLLVGRINEGEPAHVTGCFRVNLNPELLPLAPDPKFNAGFVRQFDRLAYEVASFRGIRPQFIKLGFVVLSGEGFDKLFPFNSYYRHREVLASLRENHLGDKLKCAGRIVYKGRAPIRIVDNGINGTTPEIEREGLTERDSRKYMLANLSAFLPKPWFYSP